MDAEVRSALPLSSFRTRLVGSLADGAECLITSGSGLQFFPQYAPAANELIEVNYRGGGQAATRVINSASIAAHATSDDDGIRAAVRDIQLPAPRTAVDCENAALAILDDAAETIWSGEYQAWNDFFPLSSEDIYPGDAIVVSAPSRTASFTAIVRAVEIAIKDLDGDHWLCKVHFADDATHPLDSNFRVGA